MSISRLDVTLKTTLAMAVITGIARPVHAQSLYDIDFGTPPHTVGQPPTTGGGPPPRNTVTNIVVGTPTVVSSFGALTDQPLEFDSFDGQGDQIRLQLLDVPEGLLPATFYIFESEVLIAEQNSGDALRILFDTPEVRFISFVTGGTIGASVPSLGNPFSIGSFTLGNKVDVRVEIDLVADLWAIFLDNMLAHLGPFGGATQLGAIRFSTSVDLHPAGLSAAIDNVRVAAPIGGPPIADAGSDQVVSIGDVVCLDGLNSSDPEDGNALGYSWSLIGARRVIGFGPPAIPFGAGNVSVLIFGDPLTLSGDDTATPCFVAPDTVESFTFRLTVTDSDGNVDTDDVVVTVLEENLDRAIFVSDEFGNDVNRGSMEAPVKTLDRVHDLFRRSGRLDVYVAEGSYSSRGFSVENGMSMYGAFEVQLLPSGCLGWTRTASGPTTISGGGPLRGPSVYALRATGITVPTVIDGFEILAPDGVDGETSIAIYIRNATEALRISNNTIVAGLGADGRRGANGAPGENGNPGSDARFIESTIRISGHHHSVEISFEFRITGAGGSSPVGRFGGRGGLGGDFDFHSLRAAGLPPFVRCAEAFDGRDGRKGSPAAVGGRGGDGAGDQGGYPPLPDLFPLLPPRGQRGNSGQPGGRGLAPGVDGSPEEGRGFIRQRVGVWSPGSGLSGTRGDHGRGAGGGGGGGAGWALCGVPCITTIGIPGCCSCCFPLPIPPFAICFCKWRSCILAYGAGGGGGGAGGLGGFAGSGGRGGGGSFGIFLHNSSPEIVNNVISTKGGGDGGAGGQRGVGGEGGQGGAGLGAPVEFGVRTADTPGGFGGPGGDGALGGRGGGGRGGPSCGIFKTGREGSAPVLANNTFDAGGISLIGPAGFGGGPNGEIGFRAAVCPLTVQLPGLPPPPPIPPGKTVPLPWPVPGGMGQVFFFLSYPGSEIVMTLVTPSGTLIDRDTVDPNVLHQNGTTFEIYTITEPEAGDWTVLLFGADVPEGGEVATVSVTGTPANQAPSADAGPDVTIEAASLAGTSVTLDGSASTDPDGEALSFEWSDEAGNVARIRPRRMPQIKSGRRSVVSTSRASASGVLGTSPQLELILPFGTHVFRLTVTDGGGGVASDTVTVTVQDTTPPTLIVDTPVIRVTLPTATAAGASVDLSGAATATDNADPDVTITHDGPALFPLGTTEVTITAIDDSGNFSQAPFEVWVVYDFVFLPPIQNDGSSNFNPRQTIPVKFQLTAADGTIITNAGARLGVLRVTSQGTLEPVTFGPAGNSNIGDLFDATGNHYRYNLKTDGFTPGLYLLQVLVNDQTQHAVNVSLVRAARRRRP